MHLVGVTSLIAPCSVGSLQPDIHPEQLVVVDQMIDRTWGRADTFHDVDRDIRHQTFAEPYDAGLRAALVAAARRRGADVRDGGTMVVINGPRSLDRGRVALVQDDGVGCRQHDGLPGSRARRRARDPLRHGRTRDRLRRRSRRPRTGDDGTGLDRDASQRRPGARDTRRRVVTSTPRDYVSRRSWRVRSLDSVYAVSPTSTTSCLLIASRRRRSSRVTRRGCWSTGATPRPSTVTCAISPALLAPGRSPRAQRDEGDPGPAARCIAPPAARPRCCCWNRSTASAACGRRWCGRRQAQAPARRCMPPTAHPSCEIGAAHRSRRHVHGQRSSDPSTRWMCSPSTARCRCRPTSRPPARSRPLPDHLRPPTGQRGGAHRRTAFHAGACSTRSPRRRRDRQGRARGRARHVPADQHRRPARPPHAHRALPRPGGRRCRRVARRGRVVAVGTTAVRALESAAARGELERPDRHLHPPRLRLAGRRRADDQLPPARARRC